MSRFGLQVQLSPDSGCDGSSCEIHSKAITSRKYPQDSFFVANALDFSISFAGPFIKDDKTTSIIVFVPPALIESALSDLRIRRQHCWINENKEHVNIANNFLRSIHPRLIETRQKLKGIFVFSGEIGFPRRFPADIVLLDTYSMTEGSINELLMDLNGEFLSFQPNCILKMLTISNIDCSMEQLPDLCPSFRIPPCPVCLHRIDPAHFSLPKPHNHQRCSNFCVVQHEDSKDTCINQRLLKAWDPPSHCSVCQLIQTRWSKPSNTDYLPFCNRCAMQETLWVCMTCGFVGCGRYSQRHAAEHFDESKHPYSLELATLRIWNYASGEFAHRGDILECPSIRKYHPILDLYGANAAARKPEQSQGLLDDRVSVGFAKAKYEYEGTFAMLPSESPKKATMIGEEYEALLQSALEDQAQHYEGEISRLRAALTAEQIDRDKMTEDEMQQIIVLDADIERLRSDIDHVGRQLLEAQALEAGHRAVSQRLLREQGVAKSLLEKIQEETAKEHEMGKQLVEELEQQVADLTGNLSMRHSISQNEELNNAHIFGTTASPQPSSTKWGKKGKRSNRK